MNIHFFNHGNGHTARLLMKLILIRGGYPPVAVRPEDRPDYVRTLQKGTGRTRAFTTFCSLSFTCGGAARSR